MPDAGHWDGQLSEFILNYDDARAASSPDAAIFDFCESGAELAQWYRESLERHGG